jgi:hypothetical protein
MKVVVKFDQEQLKLLDNLKKEKEFGGSYRDIITRVFRNYVRQELGRGGVK